MIIRQSPADSAVVRAVVGNDAAWDLKAHLLAGIADLLSAANWQRAGDDKAQRPDPIPRPGVKRHAGEQIGQGKPVTPEEMNARLGWKTE